MKIPIDPEMFAEKLGWTVSERSDGVPGSTGIDRAARTITVTSGLRPEQRRWEVAVALGRVVWEDRDGNTEEAASRFARSLLIPDIAVKVVIDRRGIRDPVRIRRLFGVTAEVLYHRMQELGWVG